MRQSIWERGFWKMIYIPEPERRELYLSFEFTSLGRNLSTDVSLPGHMWLDVGHIYNRKTDTRILALDVGTVNVMMLDRGSLIFDFAHLLILLSHARLD